MDKNKLEEKISNIRQEATKIEEALQNQKERRELAKVAGEQPPKGRTFANPQTADEAEGKFPTMEELASKVLKKKGTKEEILNEGTLLDKLRLYYSSRDLDGYFDTDGDFSKEDFAKVRASIQSEEDMELVRKCVREFSTLIEFSRRLSYQFKRFQTSFSLLAVLLNKWDSYEETAGQLTKLYEIISKVAGRKVGMEDIEGNLHEDWLPFNQDQKQEVLQTFFNGTIKYQIAKGAYLAFDMDTESFYIDPYISTKGEASLYSQIKREAKQAAAELCDFKAYVKAAEEYIKESTLHYLPISMQMSIENAEEERYTRYLVKNLSFFRSELNDKRERGETVSPEEEKRAVIPDYYECKPTAKIYRECKRGLKLLESGKTT